MTDPAPRTSSWKDASSSRRTFMQMVAGTSVSAASAAVPDASYHPPEPQGAASKGAEAGVQRLSLAKLRSWENLKYGMFIHFGMGTFVGGERFNGRVVYPDIPDGKAPITAYNPDKLDVDQWIQIARDAGMKYAVLTAKHVAGHCLWPSRHTDYTVARSPNKTDVVEAFVKCCERRGVRPGLYYNPYDNHHRFGQVNRSPEGYYPWHEKGRTTTYTTSLYQDFHTAQVTELLNRYGPLVEVWSDIPQLLGRGYRRFLYELIARLQPETLVMMNGRPLDLAWPTDIMAFERDLPPSQGHVKLREVEGRSYYLPGEFCNPIGKEWFYVEGDQPRSDQQLLANFLECRKKDVNFLLDVPPDKHGLIPKESQAALMRLRKNAKL